MLATADNKAFARARALLSAGDYVGGLRLYEHRPNRSATNARQLSYPEWDGSDLTGKSLLVWPEQGFGDQIMTARFLRGTGAARVTVATKAPLVRLLAPLVDEVLEINPAEMRIPRHDAWVMHMSLLHRLGIRPDAIPSGPYLKATELRRVGRIGISWRGSDENPKDHLRSLPEVQARRLLALPGAIDLDPSATGARDFQDTADIIAGLDLVISVDTATAHLAGALGATCWTLLSAGYTDWRWMRHRSDSPWYSTMRLWRQPKPGDWPAVIDGVLGALV